MSALRRTTEEWVSEDWAAVARVINERVQALGWKQRELAARSQVS
ncbi:XRE family transcriptional regulator, partial [Amycolatopsis jiangsuensis]